MRDAATQLAAGGGRPAAGRWATGTLPTMEANVRQSGSQPGQARSARHMRRLAAALLLAVGVGGGCAGAGDAGDAAPADADRGAAVYAASCVACHGAGATGTDLGPPLVDHVYRPGHHADGAFLVAVRRGVPQHHWDFGVMPAIPGLSDGDVRDVTAYVRQLQRAAGIE